MRLRRLSVACLAAATLIAASAGTPAEAGGERECLGQTPTIIAVGDQTRGTDGDDIILDDSGRALIQSGLGDDLICMPNRAHHEVYSGPGNDRVVGGLGEDFIYPGSGDDLVRTGAGADLVTDDNAGGDDRLRGGGGGEDAIRFSVTFSRDRPAAVRVDLARGTVSGHGADRLDGFEEVEGTARPDVILGSPGDDVLWGVRGNDRISGAGGDDVVIGASVRVGEAAVDDRFDGSDPWLRGGPGNDEIYGRIGDDNLFGGPGADLLDGGSHEGSPGDTGDGGPGTDTCRELERVRGCEQPPDSRRSSG